MRKVYLRATGLETFEWVNSPELATQDAWEKMGITLEQLKGATLELGPNRKLRDSVGWIISKEVAD